MDRRPHPCAPEQRPIAPVAALRADQERRPHSLEAWEQSEGLSAEPVADDEQLYPRRKLLFEEIEGRAAVEEVGGERVAQVMEASGMRWAAPTAQ